MDIDIDLPSTFNPKTFFSEAVPASRVQNGQLKVHNVGCYFQNIPVDRFTGISAIPYLEAERFGFFKIDFLHLTILDSITTKDEVRKLVREEPDWGLLGDEQTVQKLFQIRNHFKTIQKVKPKSVIELADTIALIRPGKRRLLPYYLKDKQGVRPAVYQQDSEEYTYKKSHAVAYALTIVLQLHLIKQGRL